MSRFDKVGLSRSLENRASQTFLRHFSNCPRSAYLYAAYKGEAQNDAMVRGEAFHLAIERAVTIMVEQGEATMETDLMESITDEALAELPVPFSEHDYVRECAYRWASEWSIDPAKIVAVERLFVLDLAGWEVRCKIDYADTIGPAAVRIADWKSSRAPATQDEIARKREDGSLVGKQLQLILYALALAYGVPVTETVTPCDECDGRGVIYLETLLPGPRSPVRFEPVDLGEACPECEERGHHRTQERAPFPLAADAQLFQAELVYPGVEGRDGLMVRRPVTFTRLELAKYRESLIGVLERLSDAEKSGDWPAIVTSEGCAECPCPPDCPIPVQLRNHAGEVNTLEQAREAAEWVDRQGDKVAAVKKELREWAKAHGVEIEYGKDKALRFIYSESERIPDKDGMFAAITAAVELGRPFNPDDWVRVQGVNNFKAVKVDD